MIALLLSFAPAAHADLIEVAPPIPVEEALSDRVARACGDPYQAEQIDFTFVVEVDGAEKLRRKHSWSPKAGSVIVGTGDKAVTVSTLEAPPANAPELQRDAYAAFINDSYWLLAPCKVKDEGVKLIQKDRATLELAFEGVGLTPGDRYTLSVNPSNGQVERWSFVLQSGREGSFSWEPYQQHGPISVSTVRRSDDGSVIRFEEVSAR